MLFLRFFFFVVDKTKIKFVFLIKQSNKHQVALLAWQGIAYQSCKQANKYRPEPENVSKNPENCFKAKAGHLLLLHG